MWLSSHLFIIYLLANLPGLLLIYKASELKSYSPDRKIELSGGVKDLKD